MNCQKIQAQAIGNQVPEGVTVLSFKLLAVLSASSLTKSSTATLIPTAERQSDIAFPITPPVIAQTLSFR